MMPSLTNQERLEHDYREEFERRVSEMKRQLESKKHEYEA